MPGSINNERVHLSLQKKNRKWLIHTYTHNNMDIAPPIPPIDFPTSKRPSNLYAINNLIFFLPHFSPIKSTPPPHKKFKRANYHPFIVYVVTFRFPSAAAAAATHHPWKQSAAPALPHTTPTLRSAVTVTATPPPFVVLVFSSETALKSLFLYHHDPSNRRNLFVKRLYVGDYRCFLNQGVVFSDRSPIRRGKMAAGIL